MKSIIVKELKLILKEKRSYFFLLIMPLLMIVMFGSVFGNTDDSTVDIHVIDQDHSLASKAFLSQMGHIKGINLEKTASKNTKDEIDKIKKGQLSSVIVINKGFQKALKEGKQADLKLYQDPSSASSVAPVKAVLKNIANGYREQKLSQTLAAKGISKEDISKTLAQPIVIKDVNTTATGINYISQIVPGMTVMFVFYIMISMAKRFFDEKKSGLLARVQSTTVKPYQYLIGMWLPFVIIVFAQCVLLFAFGHWVYNLNLGDLAALGLIIICISICSSGLGLALSLIVSSENMAMVISQIIALGGAMVGGLWMPSYLMPSFVQTIGQFTPQFWAQKSLQDVIARGAHIGNVIDGLAILTAFGIVGLIVAMICFPRFLRSAAN
ncbi:ABC-2 type transport system permease protein [Scopulibacillus daqui]|uniref:ABC-2 type transport system permease protein n=1 Tax=Scopulibacillus daqui TaxID=1469162 RepID=A0ABS2PX56_9BACL|nr:ABC transporter permease [Scopulibacillus daqui]MBM7644634.1 ABC-2 type transport system permease protein [Scopulibacillus daqui]